MSLVNIGEFWINPDKVVTVGPQVLNPNTRSVITFDNGHTVVVHKTPKDVADAINHEASLRG